MARLRARVLAAVLDADEVWLTTREVSERLGGRVSVHTLGHLLPAFVADGLIRTSGGTASGTRWWGRP